MQLTDCGPDEGRRIPDVLEALALDEIRHAVWEVVIVSLDIVLQNQSTQGSGWLVFGEKGMRKISVSTFLFFSPKRIIHIYLDFRYFFPKMLSCQSLFRNRTSWHGLTFGSWTVQTAKPKVASMPGIRFKIRATHILGATSSVAKMPLGQSSHGTEQLHKNGTPEGEQSRRATHLPILTLSGQISNSCWSLDTGSAAPVSAENA